MTPPHVQWGTSTLHLDNEAFCRGFLSVRQWYSADIYGERGRAPEELQHAVQLTSEDVLWLIAVSDDQGCYHLGAKVGEDVAECLGYLGGQLAPQEVERYRKEQAQQKYFRNSIPL